MHDTDVEPQRALVLHPRTRDDLRTAQYELEEAVGLTEALDLVPVHSEIVPLREIRANTFFAGGKIEEVKARVSAESADVVVVNASDSAISQAKYQMFTYKQSYKMLNF